MSCPAAPVHQVIWQEDGTATVLARFAGRQGSGAATGVAGEGKWVRQVDLLSITVRVFDETTGEEITDGAQTVAIADVILDVPVTSTELWTADTVGYNFLHDLAAEYFPDGGHHYRAEYKYTFQNGAIAWGLLSGLAAPVMSS